MQKGWVYVLTNPAMPGLIKIGFTFGSPERRARQLTGTGLPKHFDVAYALFVDNPKLLEAAAHDKLVGHRVNSKREFFRYTTDAARMLLQELCGGSFEKELLKGGAVVSSTVVVESGEKISCPNCGQSVAPFNSVFTDRAAGTTKCAWCGQSIRFQVKVPKSILTTVSTRPPLEQNVLKAKISGNYFRATQIGFECPHCRAESILKPNHVMRCPYCGKSSQPHV